MTDVNAWRPGTIGEPQGPNDEPQGPADTPQQAPSRAPAQALPPAPAAAPSPFQTAAAVTELRGEIAASLFRMLQGKVTGRDVLHADGQVLAAEGAPITAELAALAEQAGVLPELVLHMAWPPEPEREPEP